MRKPGRILLFVALALALVTAGTRWIGGEVAPQPPAQDVTSTNGTHGMLVAIDPETGTLTQPSPEQIRELQEGVSTGAAQKSGVETFVLDDGTVGAVLDESFDHFMTVHIDADGNRHASCQQGASCTHLQTHGGTDAAALPEE
jgi:hypothetical protein